MVGARQCTPGGAMAAAEFAAGVADVGLVVCSGLALGVDTHAHKGALSANGDTVAVLGSGVERIYPKQNIALAHQVAERGALVSECWPTEPPTAHNFPKRNRIISGLSLGTIVVEAAIASGSLITARLAAEQNREVFAVPGSIFSEQSRGCHALIQQGAKLVANINDVLEELPTIQRGRVNQIQQGDKGEQTLLPFKRVLDSVGFETTDIDSIINRSGFEMAVVLEQLLTLELQNWIRAVPGGYVRIKRS
ncbi:hypothetical protein GCM10007894_28050 [Paraferrimonas haliotis]|uniref:DNA protecting protein DprA n=1 Tax=Paraferrimonas haliotis TaxID=2013866 RepID=A0AA37WXV7_9GAMM|nr:hypothetical protein GCM10007894_28050 [Paraferrimonas haliotis]